MTTASTTVPFAKPADFKRDQHGRIASSVIGNVRLALSKLDLCVRFDAFARAVRVDGAPFDDACLDGLWVQIDDAFGFRPSKELLATIITTEAHKAPVHPVRDYLDALAWDRRPRLDTWLITYGGAADSPYVRAVSALPLIAAVRRVREPGSKFDELLVLEAKQGALKSSAVRALCGREDWFSDDLPLGVDSKNVIERTSGRWIIEAAELHGHRGRETEALKAFLSRQVDGPVRLAYARMPTTAPRQFILIGTTNTAIGYLKDPTGSRRFWPVTVTRFDLDALTRDRDQLWAEAAHREAAGDSIRLDPTLWAAASAQQEDRRAADPWEAILEPLLETDDGVVTVESLWSALQVQACHQDNRHADRVAAIVQRHGYSSKQKLRINGRPQWCWVRKDGAQ